jgi:ABC-2 type transport system ATP-binding protein
MTTAAIQLTDVCFAYAGHTVLQGISFDVAQGEIYGLVGADGAGKSTLLQLAVGQLNAQSGGLSVLGTAPDDPNLRGSIAYMPQGFGLYQDLSIVENLQFFADLHGLSRFDAAQKIRALLQQTGLQGFEGRRAGQLSGGMMQKLALACALVTQPRAMFLDEPTTGVDPLSRRAFWRLLDNVRAQGVAIVYATANMDEAERCDRIGMLNAGRIERQGSATELAAGSDMVLISIEGSDVRRYRAAVGALTPVRFLFPIGSRLNAWLPAGSDLHRFQQQLTDIAAHLTLHEEQPTLHDVALRDLAQARRDRRSRGGD